MLDMQTVLGMPTNRNIVVRDLYYQGTNVDDGLLCHIFKAILWLGIEESWYKTISRITRVYAVTTTLKPKAYLLLSRPEIKKLCEKYFKNIGG